MKEKRRDPSKGIEMRACVFDREEKERERRGRGRQRLSKPSHDLIKAIHHIWIIRQQHGSHDQSPSVRTHVRSHPSLLRHKRIAATEKKTREAGTQSSLTYSAVALYPLRTIAQN